VRIFVKKLPAQIRKLCARPVTLCAIHLRGLCFRLRAVC
jgi:hypothetical protein